jgi:HD-GYP domain-containing protein (c-di-GMP phosphodiesterase class II)
MDTDKLHLKKIKIEELKVGMFIVNMDRSWFKHPFLSGKKMITSENQIEKLRQYGVQEVYIDPEKGEDVVDSETAEPSVDLPVQSPALERTQDVGATGPTMKSPDPPAHSPVLGRTQDTGAMERGKKSLDPPAQPMALRRTQDIAATGPTMKSPDPQAQAIVGLEEEKVLLQELSEPAPQTIGNLSSANQKGHILLAKEIEMARVVQREAQIVIRDIMQDVRLGKNIESDRVKRVVNNMIDSIFSNQAALASLTRIKDYDEYTFVHSINVCILCLTLGRHLNFSREELEQMGIGALLHDVGKMRIPPHILNKPGKLTEEEFTEVKKHPLYTLEVLDKSHGIPDSSKQVALQHHERYNGRGYPRGLRGEEIGRFGQIAAIIDVYDAITADRVYKKAIPLHEGIRMIYQGIREDFNQPLVEHFIQCMGIYPTGTLVLLDSEEIGIVCAVNPGKLLRPNIMLIYQNSKTRYPQPLIVDLTEKGDDSQWFKRTIVMPLDSRKWNVHIDDFLNSLKKATQDPASQG